MPVMRFDIMQGCTRKPDTGRTGPSSVRSDGGTKKVRKVHARTVPYRVGYSWNKGGRLKELRIRHLARKFLKIWMQNVFGRVLPHIAKCHYGSVVLRRAFEGWREEWWTSRREWSLTMRAECHYRYYLYNWGFHSWRKFMALQKEKKSKLQNAHSYADRQRMRLVWDRWEVFTEMRRMKKRMLKSALEQNRLATLHSALSFWQTRLQQHQDLYTLEDQALKQHALTLQRRAWLQWKEMKIASCGQKEKESRASLYFIVRLKRKTLYQWMSYISCCQKKRKSQAVAQRACYLRLVRICWSNWSKALQQRWSEEDRLQAAEQLAIQSTKRRALERWRAYVMLCRDEGEINQIASQHHQHHLLSAGLQGLSLNVIWNKKHRLNNNMAVQHYYQTMIRKFWKLWQHRLEEAEDKHFQSMTEMAQTVYSTSVLGSCFHYWREKLTEQRHMRELEHCADVCFAERMLPQCFNSWVEYILQRRLHKQRRHKAEVYNQQRQYSWIFYTWWERSEKRKEQMLSERMAILHEERCHKNRAWARWRQRTEQQINEQEKQKASDHLYLHRLLHNTMTEWKDNSAEIRDRRNREQQACRQGDLHCMKWSLEKWKKFVWSQRVKKSKLEVMQSFYDAKLLRHTFLAWKRHHLQMSLIYNHAEELHRQQTQRFHRKVLSVWRENATLQAESRLMERRAQNHFQHFLRLKVFLAWRDATVCAVSKRHQQGEEVRRAQRSIDQVHLLQSFRHWRKQTREALRERMCMEKARQHHNSKLLSKAMKTWNKHHYQYQKYKVMKRQGILLLRLKMYQTYFEHWKIKLQHRRREVKQTERALWHWSLTLQARVLCGWRLWVIEQRRQQEQAARAAQVYRDQLLREGVTCILTYAAHMNDLTTSITQLHQGQSACVLRSHDVQRAVKRCAMRWKHRALSKPGREQPVKGQPVKKSVTFCLTPPGLKSVSSFDSVEQEAEDGDFRKLLLTRKPRRQPHRCKDLFESPLTVLPRRSTQNQSCNTGTETAPKHSEFRSSSQKKHPAVVSSLLTPEVLVNSTCQSTFTSNVLPSEPHASVVDPSHGTQNEDLLPPSAFMTTRPQNMVAKTSSPGSADAPFAPFHQFVAPYKHNSTYPEIYLSASSEDQCESILLHVENSVTDPASALTRDLLSIQLDMKSFQQDRKQLRAWQKLKEVLQSWLQTSGEDEQMEKKSVSEELKELEERIARLSAELAKRKPAMLLHTERIQHLQTALKTSGVSSLCRKSKDLKTDHSVYKVKGNRSGPHTPPE